MKRFEIRHERTDSHDHYMCSDYEWSVIDAHSGETIATFEQSYVGAEVTGATDVSLSEDGREIVVTWHDGRVERRPLPT